VNTKDIYINAGVHVKQNQLVIAAYLSAHVPSEGYLAVNITGYAGFVYNWSSKDAL
jgi:hypothetical protein